MSDIHALSGAYAVDALDDIERAQFERHLATCDSCRSEVDSLRDASALLAATTAVEPPTSLRERVLAQIDTVRPLPPVVAAEPQQEVRPAGSTRRRWLTALVAAAAAVVAVGAGNLVYDVVSDNNSPVSAVDEVLHAEDAERYTQTFAGGATATVVRSPSLNEAVLLTEGMPAAPSGHDYALWLQHDDKMVPAGIMPEGPDNAVLLDGDPASADGAGISVEEAGTEPPSPQGEVVALFEFQQV